MDTSSARGSTESTRELERQSLSRRREFLKRALLTPAYVAPVMLSFASADLARASDRKHHHKEHDD